MGKARGKSRHNDSYLPLCSLDIDDKLPVFHTNNSRKCHNISTDLCTYDRCLVGFQIRYDCVYTFLRVDFSIVICYSFLNSRKRERCSCPIRSLSNLNFFGICNSGQPRRIQRSLRPDSRNSSIISKSTISRYLFVVTIFFDDWIRYPK